MSFVSLHARFAEVAVSLPVHGIFTYSIPEGLRLEVSFGKRVLVPFGQRTVTGYVVGIKTDSPLDSTKDILDVLDDHPLFDEQRFKFLKWMSSYYFSSLGEVLSLTHPRFLNIKSQKTLCLTDEGKRFLCDAPPCQDGMELEILRRAQKAVALKTLLKQPMGTDVSRTIEALKKRGLLKEDIALKGGRRTVFERLFSLNEGIDEGLLNAIQRYPLQKHVADHLRENPLSAPKTLRKKLGPIDSALKRLMEKGIVIAVEREVLPQAIEDELDPEDMPEKPNEEQGEAIGKVMDAFERGGFSPFLLFGVTGSGKTFVYVKIIEEALKRGRRAIVLVPEITLTASFGAHLTAMFRGRVAFLHSALKDSERFYMWQNVRSGKADIVVGPRSALLAPLENTGVIIVDEEHDTSYKQEEGVRYNARDSALMLGKILGIPVILGSATPSMESFYNAKKGRIELLCLRKRVMDRSMPEIEIVDMRKKGFLKGLFSDRLSSLLHETIRHRGQALFFLNRRGFSNLIACMDCGHIFTCLNCSVTLTFHKQGKSLRCHYCDFAIRPPEVCPKCKGNSFRDPGAGTERIEEELRRLFPSIRIGRMDRDTVRVRGSAKRIIEAVRQREIDVLVGTQMVSKGHHFPGITLVGVVSGDTSLNIPDFRGAERTFQLISQASGRAGRGNVSGRVVIQTLNPLHYCLRYAKAHDYEGFFEEELKQREEAFYPPYARLALLRVEATDEKKVETAASDIKKMVDSLIRTKRYHAVTALGPAPLLVEKLKGRSRRQFLVKAVEANIIHGFMAELKKAFEEKKRKAVTLIVDIDPLATV
ncbi:MAG: primosomal protein N' [Deltaproteobacteria bacterium]|nr:primosomal protein N' [Deltaproteobacteria bacterium]